MAATDISKITEKSPWQDITEGNQVYANGTSKQFHTGEWSPTENVEILTMTTAKAAAFAQRSAHLAQLQ